MLMNNVSRDRGSTEVLVYTTRCVVEGSIASWVVQIAWHFLHSRRRHTCVPLARDLEFDTKVGDAQYIQFMRQA